MRRRRPDVTQLVEAYGPHPLQVGEWFAPEGNGVAPAVVLIHGGFWRKDYDRHLEYHVARNLAELGYVCWNIDYRSSAEPWPSTLTDVADAYDHLVAGAFAERVDPWRVAVRRSLGRRPSRRLARVPSSAPRRRARPQPGRAAARARRPAGRRRRTDHRRQQEGWCRRAAGAARWLAGNGARALRDRRPDRPGTHRSPLGVDPFQARQAGTSPASQIYVERATEAGDDCRLEIPPGDHFLHLDPKSAAHRMLCEALATMTE